MTQEEKQVLLKDLCARLPYGVKVQVYYEDIAGSGYFDETVWLIDNDEPFHVNDRWIENIKPYLRPMSSMTEEDRNLIRKYCDEHDRLIYDIGVSGQVHSKNIVDWLNAHHFDFRGLIEKGLAIEVTENNNPYKE